MSEEEETTNTNQNTKCDIKDESVHASDTTAVAVTRQPLTEAAAVQLQESQSLISAYKQAREVLK